jgi:anti-sigma factor RsiW
MNCAEMNLLLHAYVDDELDVARSLEVQQHVKACANCAKKMNSLKSLHSAFKESDLTYNAPASLRRSAQKMAGISRERQTPHLFDLQWLWKWLAVGSLTVAVIAIVTRPAGISPNDELTGEVVSSHVRSLMAGHLTDVLSSDKHTVKPWFAGKLDFSPGVTDFADQGFSLIGGRLDYIEGRAVAALVYQHNKHFINVFIWPATNTSALTSGNYHGYNILSFDANGFHYSLVSDMDETGMNQLADLLGEPK